MSLRPSLTLSQTCLPLALGYRREALSCCVSLPKRELVMSTGWIIAGGSVCRMLGSRNTDIHQMISVFKGWDPSQPAQGLHGELA